MDTSKIEKDIVIAAVVRTFFKYFVSGIIEAQDRTDINERMQPKNVKATMLRHYEKIAECFNREAFYSIFKMNYRQEEMEPTLRSFMKKETTHMELMRLACRTDRFYETMVCEYKRNFEQLLLGRIETQDEHVGTYTRCPEAGEMDLNLAESIIESLAAGAYSLGKTIEKKN